MHHSWRGRRNAALPPFELSRALPQTCGVCRIPFEIMVIDVDGDVSPCTVAMRKEMIVGSLLAHSLADLWGMRMARNRKQLLDLTTRQEGSQCLGCKHFPKAALEPAWSAHEDVVIPQMASRDLNRQVFTELRQWVWVLTPVAIRQDCGTFSRICASF